MSKKSSSFKRKLRSPKIGFRYFRIWGHPVEPRNFTYFKEKLKPGEILFKFRGRDIFLRIYEEFVGMEDRHTRVGNTWVRHRVPYSKYLRARYRSSGLCGSILLGSYYRTLAQAQRELDMYASGCQKDGLPELIQYHTELDVQYHTWA